MTHSVGDGTVKTGFRKDGRPRAVGMAVGTATDRVQGGRKVVGGEALLRSIVHDDFSSLKSQHCVSIVLFVSLSQITNTEYFAPLLTVNQHASHRVLEEIPSVDTFARLSNWLMRPVPTVTTAVRRFRERYFEDNYVIGERECFIIPIGSELVL